MSPIPDGSSPGCYDLNMYCDKNISKVEYMKKIIKAMLLSAVLFSQQGWGQNLTCYGFLSHAWVDSSNRFYIAASYRGDHTMICDLDTEWNGISTEVCKSWFAVVQSIISAGRFNSFITVRYVDTPHASCADLPLYSDSPAPLYVMYQRR